MLTGRIKLKQLMLKLKTGIRTESFQLPLKSAIQLAGEIGVDGIEVNARTELRPNDLSKTAIRHIKKLLSDQNLKICSVAFLTRRGYGDSDDLERRVEATKAAMRMAYDLGCDHVSNSVSAETGSSENRSTLVEALTDIGMFGQRVGARLAIRTGSDDGQTLSELISAVPMASIAVDFDPAELLLNKHSPVEVLKSVGQHVVHFRARDAVHDLTAGQSVVVQLGRGSNDWPSLLATLEENHYDGFLTLVPQNERAVVETQESLEYLQNLFG